jgi:peptidyl-prolyl cis-trans isomerase SurA
MARLRRLLVGLTILVTASWSARAEVIDRILAVVDTQIITLSDVRAALRFGLVPDDVSTDPTGAILQRLIDRRLMLVEVDRYAPPEPGEAAVNASVAAVERRFKDALGLEIALNQSALTREELRRHLRDTLRIESYLQQRFSTAVQVSDDDAVRYYREHPEDFMRDGRLRSFEEVRDIARTRVIENQRAAFVRQWIDGLRKRGSVQLLYLPAAEVNK